MRRAPEPSGVRPFCAFPSSAAAPADWRCGDRTRIRLQRCCAAVLMAVSVGLTGCRDEPVAPDSRLALGAPEGHQDVAAVALAAAMVSGSGHYMCGLKLAGSAMCWGSNFYGQVTGTPSTTFEAFEHAGPFSQISAGHWTTCAVKLDRTVACWGAGTSTGPHPHYGQANVPAGLAGVTQVDVELGHACAVTDQGTVQCWGRDSQGEVSGAAAYTGIVQVSAGIENSCALKTDATVVCWGRNLQGESTVPTGLAGVVQISTGWHASCALKNDGTVVCWGQNVYGQLNVPSGLTDISKVAVGMAHVCVVKESGTVVCWGDFSFGQTSVPNDLADVVQVAAGSEQSCALTRLNEVICWSAHPIWMPVVPLYLNFPQTITFTSTAPFPGRVGTSYEVSATGGGSGNPVTFRSQFPDVCSVTGSSVSFLTGGTCSVIAEQAGNAMYSPGFRRQEIVVFRILQTITFTSIPPSPAYVDDSYVVSATGGGSGNPVVFSSVTPAVCTLVGATVTFVSAGTCRVAANQDGSRTHTSAATQVQTIGVVTPTQPQALAFTSVPPDPALLGASYSASATGGGSGNPVTFSSLTPAVCPLSGATVTFVAVGTCSIAADQAGNAQYDPAVRATQTFSVTYVFGATTGGGFAPPVSNTTFNSARAGQSVPVKFDLGGDQGLLVIAGGYPLSVAIACPNSNDPVNVLDEVSTTAGQSSLSYDPATALYTYVWKSNKAWAGTCREFVLKLADNTEHRARFQFVK